MILLGSDHNGVLLKAALAEAMTTQNIPWLDFGPMRASEITDYNQIASQVANALTIRLMTQHTNDRAILICGTGMGMSIAANKILGARAALVHNQIAALKSREHNDANICCLGAWINPDETNISLALEWLETQFGEGRHVRRVESIERQEHRKIIFANGVFDILHKGHIEMLQWARSLGNRLVVAINTDASTSALKGPGRPVNSENDRKAVLSALKFVDEVLLFDDLSPQALIQELRPQVVVRGGEFTAGEIRMRDAIPAEVEVKIFPRAAGYSTTEVIARARHG